MLWPCRDCHCSHIKVGCLQTKHSQIEQDFIDFLFQNEQDDLGQISPKEDADEGFNSSTRDRQVDHTLVNSISDFTFDFSREDPAFKKMVSLCRDSTYTEFFWFPNRGTEEGYWENCWTDDGNEEDAVDINESVADEYQVDESIYFSISVFLTP